MMTRLDFGMLDDMIIDRNGSIYLSATQLPEGRPNTSTYGGFTRLMTDDKAAFRSVHGVESHLRPFREARIDGTEDESDDP